MGPPSVFKRQVQPSRARPRFRAHVMVALVLVPATVWPITYFWTQTPTGQERLSETLTERLADGLIRYDAIGWGPSPTTLWLKGAVIYDRADQVALTADSLTVDVDLLASLTVGPTVRRAVARGFGVHLRWDERGDFNLSRPWLRVDPSPRPDPPEAPSAGVRFQSILLDRGDVTLGWPSWSLAFGAVSSSGSLSLGGEVGLDIAAELHGGEAAVTVGDRTLRVDEHHIEGFEWSGRRFGSERVAVQGEGITAEVTGEMGVSTGFEMTTVSALSIAQGAAGTLLTPWIPEGASVTRLAVDKAAHGPWSFSATDARVPKLDTHQVNVSGFAASFTGEYGEGALLPRAVFETRDAVVAQVDIPGLGLGEGLRVGALDVAVGSAINTRIERAQLATLTIADAQVRELSLDGTVIANMGGGAVKGTLVTSGGEVRVEGPVETSVLRRRATVPLAITLKGVIDGLRVWLSALLPASYHPAGQGPWSGQASGRLEASAGGVGWSWTHVDWGEGVP